MISTAFNLLSFIFNTAMRMHMRQAIQKSLEEGSEVRDMELFGLKWGELSAEEALGGEDLKNDALEEELRASRKSRRAKSTKQEKQQSPGTFSETILDTTTDEEETQPPAQATKPFEEGGGEETEALAEEETAEKNPFVLSEENFSMASEAAPTGVTAETMEEVKRIMLSRIAQDRAKLSFLRAKEKLKEARAEKAKRTRRAWNVAKTSVRLIAESLNYGLNKVLARFGAAWHWAVVRLKLKFCLSTFSFMYICLPPFSSSLWYLLRKLKKGAWSLCSRMFTIVCNNALFCFQEVGLKKLIRRFRMLKLFGVIAAWFERVATFIRWFAGEGKFYISVFDTFRGSASFIVQNAEKISALVKGTIQFSFSTLDATLFCAMLLNAITKPVYGLYFAYQGLLEDKTRTEAMQEFRLNRKALTNFLLGSAAMESQVG